MKNGPNRARIAALISDQARAGILTGLMTGQALTATELARIAGVTKQTVGAHLARLLDARLLAVERQGPHPYFRLAGRDVEKLLESLMGVAHRTGAPKARFGPGKPALRKARSCYDHLAGELGVLVFDSLEKTRHLRPGSAGPEVTRRGKGYFRDFGIDIDALARQRRALCRTCLDWSMRRSHLAGTLGAAVLNRCLELDWARRTKGSRVVSFSAAGETAFRKQFSLGR